MLIPEDTITDKTVDHDLTLKESREYKEFQKQLADWKKSQETDVFIDEEDNKTPNAKSLNQQIKERIASGIKGQN